MAKTFPTAAEVRAALEPLTVPGLEKLAGASGVPFHTLLKIRDGVTKNPRLDTVCQFWPHVPRATRPAPADKAAA